MTKRSLIIGPSWVGDMVMAQSLFKTIKHTNPETCIDVLAPAWTRPLLERMPEVDKAIASPFQHGELRLMERRALGISLRGQYDEAVVLPHSFKAALIPWFANIPKRTGWLGEMRYGLLNDYRKLDKIKYPLMIEQCIALGLPANTPLKRPYPYPSFSVSAKNTQAALERYDLKLTGKPVLALCPGAEFGPSKQWPAAYYAEIATTKAKAGMDIWLFGSKNDLPIAAEIMQLSNHVAQNLVGRTTLADCIDLLATVDSVIANDSGLMHMAAALNKPLIALYGSTSPAFTPPLSPKAIILEEQLPCKPCFERTCPLKTHDCMRLLTPQKILNAMAPEKVTVEE